MSAEPTRDRKLQHIAGGVPLDEVPGWAVLQRRLLHEIDHAVSPFLERYTTPEGSLIWHDRLPAPTRDGADDFYEPFFNWPLAYLMGAGRRLLELSHRQHRAITVQLTRLGYLKDEFERGYDAFHQGESLMFFYNLCMADPGDARLRDLAVRFAELYAGDQDGIDNYDPARRIVRAPHTGSEGPRWGYFDGEAVFPWRERMRPYGLPYRDVPGVRSFDDLKDPALARTMGEIMEDRMGRGDVVGNLAFTSLAANAFALTGEVRFRDWAIGYLDAWRERATDNAGLIPDNVGLDGAVGSQMGGRPYGGAYGWSWPHGFYSVAMAALVGATNGVLLTGDAGRLDIGRTVIDSVWARGEWREVAGLEMSLAHHWHGLLPETGAAFVVPYRWDDSGWFDHQPMAPMYPAALASFSGAPEDAERLENVRSAAGFDWTAVTNQRTKEDAGHEAPWFSWLAGQGDGYPEAIMGVALSQIARRLEQIRNDTTDPLENHIHHWQELNPVTTEALLQLTMGAPSPLYNGGLLHARVRHFDPIAKRPGLPEDVAALVESIDPQGVTLCLVNVGTREPRSVLVQAGAFAEHRFDSLEAEVCTATPGPVGSYAAPEPEISNRRADVATIACSSIWRRSVGCGFG
jgi:hypothetical protein